MDIYTLTLNPAYDLHAACPDFAACRENFTSVDRRDAGGKGINLSRALQIAGIRHTALVVIGKENCSEFKEELARFGLCAAYLETEGRIRENLTIHHGDAETRISFSGFSGDDMLLERVCSKIHVSENTAITFTGSIPDGITKDAAKGFLIKLKNSGAKIVLDCRSFDLQDIIEIAPWLIKPNQQELSAWVGQDVASVEDAAAWGEKIHSSGVENVMVTMGSQGAVLACERTLRSIAPPVSAVSTIGAGDSCIAGFLAAAAEGLGPESCLRQAVAFGTAACLTEGTRPPRIEDILYLTPQISIVEM